MLTIIHAYPLIIHWEQSVSLGPVLFQSRWVINSLQWVSVERKSRVDQHRWMETEVIHPVYCHSVYCLPVYCLPVDCRPVLKRWTSCITIRQYKVSRVDYSLVPRPPFNTAEEGLGTRLGRLVYGRPSVRGLNGTWHCTTIHSPSGWQATKHDGFTLCLTKCASFVSILAAQQSQSCWSQSWCPYLIFTLYQLFLSHK